METKERFISYLKAKGIGQTAFEAKAGLSRGSIAQKTGFTASTLEKIAVCCADLSLDWLITGQGEMLKSDKPAAVVNYEHRGAPYYNVDFIGGFDLVMNDQTANPDYYIDFPPYNNPGVVWCNVTGHSMEPEIYHGDMIALKDTNETNPNYLPFGEVYALVTDNYRTIKRLSKSDKEGFIRLVPTNPAPEYASQDIPVSHIRKIYQVLVSVKRF